MTHQKIYIKTDRNVHTIIMIGVVITVSWLTDEFGWLLLIRKLRREAREATYQLSRILDLHLGLLRGGY